jgi:hypothetical protein
MVLVVRGAGIELKTGMTMLVQYEGFPLYHERLLVAGMDDTPGTWAILTPDDDLYVEEFAVPPRGDVQILGPPAAGSAGRQRVPL